MLILSGEHTGNLDSEATRAVMDNLARAHERGRSLLVVTHSPEWPLMPTGS
jgi:putative ABC transport system ATP-binding protein